MVSFYSLPRCGHVGPPERDFQLAVCYNFICLVLFMQSPNFSILLQFNVLEYMGSNPMGSYLNFIILMHIIFLDFTDCIYALSFVGFL